MDGFSPNLPMLEPSKVSLHTVYFAGQNFSRGPGLDLYAHNLGEDNSTVIG